MVSSILAVFAFLATGYAVGSIRIIKEGKAAIVERLGRYRGTLEPGFNLIFPVLDRVILIASMTEETMPISSISAITKDGIPIDVSSILYWRAYNIERGNYAVDNVRESMENLLRVILRTEIGKVEFERIFDARYDINRFVLENMDEATAPWGVKINRVEVDKIIPPDSLLEALEFERATQIKARAMIELAIAEKEADIIFAQTEKETVNIKMQGLAEAIKRIKDVSSEDTSTRDILIFLINERYINANRKLNSRDENKSVFPNKLSFEFMDLTYKMDEKD